MTVGHQSFGIGADVAIRTEPDRALTPSGPLSPCPSTAPRTHSQAETGKRGLLGRQIHQDQGERVRAGVHVGVLGVLLGGV